MKTYRVTKVCDPVRLHEELEMAGVPVVTVRASHAGLNEPAMWGVVVTQSSAVDATVSTTIAAHVEESVPSRSPSAQEREGSLRLMEML